MASRQALKSDIFRLWRSGSKPRTIVSAGLSMRPLISEGSTLTFIPCGADQSIARGDIVLFERSGGLVAHRVFGSFYRDGDLWYREKGDNRFAPGCFPACALVGRIVKIEHAGQVCDLSTPWQRWVSRAAGTYWSVLFAVLRALQALKRCIFGSLKFPRLRACTLKVFCLLCRLPARFFKQ